MSNQYSIVTSQSNPILPAPFAANGTISHGGGFRSIPNATSVLPTPPSPTTSPQHSSLTSSLTNPPMYPNPPSYLNPPMYDQQHQQQQAAGNQSQNKPSAKKGNAPSSPISKAIKKGIVRNADVNSILDRNIFNNVSVESNATGGEIASSVLPDVGILSAAPLPPPRAAINTRRLVKSKQPQNQEINVNHTTTKQLVNSILVSSLSSKKPPTVASATGKTIVKTEPKDIKEPLKVERKAKTRNKPPLPSIDDSDTSEPTSMSSVGSSRERDVRRKRHYSSSSSNSSRQRSSSYDSRYDDSYSARRSPRGGRRDRSSSSDREAEERRLKKSSASVLQQPSTGKSTSGGFRQKNNSNNTTNTKNNSNYAVVTTGEKRPREPESAESLKGQSQYSEARTHYLQQQQQQPPPQPQIPPQQPLQSFDTQTQETQMNPQQGIIPTPPDLTKTGTAVLTNPPVLQLPTAPSAPSSNVSSDMWYGVLQQFLKMQDTKNDSKAAAAAAPQEPPVLPPPPPSTQLVEAIATNIHEHFTNMTSGLYALIEEMRGQRFEQQEAYMAQREDMKTLVDQQRRQLDIQREELVSLRVEVSTLRSDLTGRMLQLNGDSFEAIAAALQDPHTPAHSILQLCRQRCGGLSAGGTYSLPDPARFLVQNFRKVTLLHMTVHFGRLDVLKEIFVAAASTMNSVGEPVNMDAAMESGKYTALHLAAMHGGAPYPDIVTGLVSNGADINSADEEGWTPLMYACRANHVDVAKALLKYRPQPRSKATGFDEPSGPEVNVNAACAHQGHTSLHFAAMNANAELCNILCEMGANPLALANYSAGQAPQLDINGKTGLTPRACMVVKDPETIKVLMHWENVVLASGRAHVGHSYR